MANPQQQENMLLTEHFSWPPISLIDDIINAVNEVLYRCTDTFEQGISGAPPHLLGFAERYAAEQRAPDKDEQGNEVFPDAALEIEEGVLKLETLMENAVDKNFDKLEIWTLRNVLCLPRGEAELARWVRLGHYAGVDAEKAREEEGARWEPERLYALRRKLVETQKLHAALAGEASRNAAQIARLRALLHPAAAAAASGGGSDGGSTKREAAASPATQHNGGESSAPAAALAFLTHTPAAQALGVGAASSSSSSTAHHPLATHASFTTSQLPHLRSLLAALRPHLASTALPPNTTKSNSSSGGGGSPDASRERRLYLESQSRRILERRGVDTTEGVEGAVEGGRVRAEEVRGLEGIVEALGRGVKGRRGDGDGDAVADADEKGEAMDTT